MKDALICPKCDLRFSMSRADLDRALEDDDDEGRVACPGCFVLIDLFPEEAAEVQGRTSDEAGDILDAIALEGLDE